MNYLTRLLGRKGVMSVTLICGPEELNSVLPEFRNLLNGFSYVKGATYAEFKEGDKVADYTLVGLITAGAGFAAVKSGLFAKLGIILAKMGKGVIVLVIAAFAALKNVFLKMFGKSRDA